MSKKVQALKRVDLEAVLMGLLIGLTVVVLQMWLGQAGVLARALALLAAGGLLCLVQYGLERFRK